jgi:phospholipid-binding lipoprotein MlaA
MSNHEVCADKVESKTTVGKLTFIVLLVMVCTGCATSGNPRDPLEGVNRTIFSLNEGVDKVALKPAAQAYEYVLPTFVRTGVTNFFGNIDDVFSGVNNLLQGKPKQGGGDFARVALNSTIGVLGLIDVATDAGFEKHDEDFGQTFGRWGVGSGPFVVIPLLGPSTVRDTVGTALDSYLEIASVDHVPTRNSITALKIINVRASLLPADKVIEEAALDKYSYIRDAYLQRRRSQIFDGNPPREIEDE